MIDGVTGQQGSSCDCGISGRLLAGTWYIRV